MKPEVPSRGYLATVTGCYCPRCREGRLFVHRLSLRPRRNMEMYVACPVCGQVTDIEVGFYYGTSYVSYLIGIAGSVVSFLLWWLVIGFSFSDHRFLAWVFLNSFGLLAAQPWLMRFSRSLWLSFFVRYNPDWRTTAAETPERINPSQMNGW